MKTRLKFTFLCYVMSYCIKYHFNPCVNVIVYVATMLNFDEVYSMCCFHTNMVFIAMTMHTHMVSISWVGI